MKTKKHLVLMLFLIAGMVIISCKKDEIAEKQSGFNYLDSDFAITHGYLDTISSIQLAITLASPNLDFASNGAYIGYGNIITFSFLHDEDNDISGTYTFPDKGYCNVRFNVVAMSGVNSYILSSSESTNSTLKINVSGDIYELEYNINMTTGKLLTGYYKGKLKAKSW